MSTIKTTYIQHPSATDPSIELSSDGSIVLPLSDLGDLANVDEGSGASDGDVLTYDGSGNLWVPAAIESPSNVIGGIVSKITTTSISTSSTAYTAWTASQFSITPSSVDSKIIIVASIVDYVPSGAYQRDVDGEAKLVRALGGTNTDLGPPGKAFAWTYGNDGPTFAIVDEPNTTSSVTYGFHVRRNGAYTAVFSGATSFAFEVSP